MKTYKVYWATMGLPANVALSEARQLLEERGGRVVVHIETEIEEMPVLAMLVTGDLDVQGCREIGFLVKEAGTAYRDIPLPPSPPSYDELPPTPKGDRSTRCDTRACNAAAYVVWYKVVDLGPIELAFCWHHSKESAAGLENRGFSVIRDNSAELFGKPE